MTQHPNSKKIKIYRASSFIERAQGAQVQDWLTQSSLAIGSYFAGQTPATGLTVKEIDLLMPGILDIDPGDRTYRQAIRKYFNAISTKVPYGTGTELEIGLETDNDAPISRENMPLKVDDYIRYRHAQGHPHVAKNQETGNGLSTKLYYIFDPTEAERKHKDLQNTKDEAMSIYLEIKKDETKLDVYLTMLNEDIRTFVNLDEKQEKLKTHVINKPADILTIKTTAFVEEKSWLRKMVLAEVVSKIGSAYYDKATTEKLGNDEMEAIAYLKDPSKEEVVRLYKAKTQETSKRAAATKRVNTKR